MTVYATVEDLQSGWRDLSPEEITTATELLARASRKCRAEVPSLDARITNTKVEAELVGDIVCDMVKRALSSVDAGLTQVSETAGPFTQSRTFSNPSGDLYLTKAEKRQLVGRSAFSITLAGE